MKIAPFSLLLLQICLTILEKLDLLGRTSEMARLFGIDFFSVLSRGSQYRVEAVMLRFVVAVFFLFFSNSLTTVVIMFPVQFARDAVNGQANKKTASVALDARIQIHIPFVVSSPTIGTMVTLHKYFCLIS